MYDENAKTASCTGNAKRVPKEPLPPLRDLAEELNRQTERAVALAIMIEARLFPYNGNCEEKAPENQLESVAEKSVSSLDNIVKANILLERINDRL